MTTPTAHPDDVRWSLDALFSGIDGDDYRAARADLEARVAALEAFADAHGLGAGAPLPASEAVRATLVELLQRQNALSELLGDVSVYLSGFVSVDAFDDAAQAEQSTLRALGARLGALDARATAWVGRLELDALLADGRFEAHAHHLRRTQEAARKQMSDAEEALAAALAPSAGDAWAKLHGDLAGKAAVALTLPGAAEPERAGLARLFVLQGDPDRATREAAYRAELELLDQHAVAFAAAMNGVKGEVGTLARRRGWGRPLDVALFQNGIDAPALEALQRAVRAAFPVMRRYLDAKARFLGVGTLTWYDRMAPVQVGEPRRFSWAEAKAFVQARFDAFAPELGALARRAIKEGWIDVLPRAGKRNGAFCMGAPGAQQSRVMLNFGGGLDDVFTLAHELGHAFHNDSLYAAGRRPLQARTPMALAETASIFCETLIANGLLAEADGATRLAVLEQDLRGATQLIVDIDSRFRLESGVFERRAERELSVAELDVLMLEAQEATYGDALDPDARHPRMWAQKPHYYSARRSFYNFPYTFGFLFGRGVFARFQAEPEGFAPRYRELLSRTGMASVAELGQDFGIDVADEAFWEGALGVTAERVEAYEGLVDGVRSSR
ncbi:MAG: M3 family oligoendopeptidase [Trueperaceae bacterium]|nr:M3 family oligoendopeptidase [Trueperaceae bacterium]